MNFSFLFAGSSSSNSMLIMLEVVLLLGWRVAGWWGIDHVLLPWLGTPWSRHRAATRAASGRRAPGDGDG
jgi:thiosulfate dehydrogenase (quinone) large subunit